MKNAGTVLHQVRGEAMSQRVHMNRLGVDSILDKKFSQFFPDATSAESRGAVSTAVEQKGVRLVQIDVCPEQLNCPNRVLTNP